MLYKRNADKTLQKELFKNPTSEYRGTPFWALNSHLTKEEMCRQIDTRCPCDEAIGDAQENE